MRAIRAPVATPACQMPNLRALLLITLAFTGFLLWQAWQQDYANPAQVVAESIRNLEFGYELLDRVPRDEIRDVFRTSDAIKISQLMRRMLGGR